MLHVDVRNKTKTFEILWKDKIQRKILYIEIGNLFVSCAHVKSVSFYINPLRAKAFTVREGLFVIFRSFLRFGFTKKKRLSIFRQRYIGKTTLTSFLHGRPSFTFPDRLKGYGTRMIYSQSVK